MKNVRKLYSLFIAIFSSKATKFLSKLTMYFLHTDLAKSAENLDGSSWAA